MSTRSGETPAVARVRALVVPIASDLGLDLYDVEQRGGTLRVTLDTLPGSAGGISLDTLALASRLVSRELDHQDPIAGHYTLEVSSPGIERPLRVPAHFQRELGRTIAVRLADVVRDERRVQGTLTAADDRGITVEVEGGGARRIEYDQIDRARTVFEWEATPKPGAAGGPKRAKKERVSTTAASRRAPARTAAAGEPVGDGSWGDDLQPNKEDS
jgi:ribosome maturation factor RimP